MGERNTYAHARKNGHVNEHHQVRPCDEDDSSHSFHTYYGFLGFLFFFGFYCFRLISHDLLPHTHQSSSHRRTMRNRRKSFARRLMTGDMWRMWTGAARKFNQSILDKFRSICGTCVRSLRHIHIKCVCVCGRGNIIRTTTEQHMPHDCVSTLDTRLWSRLCVYLRDLNE